ncbi:hypothetical protein ACHHYP_14794 [Achlya hypogyna]|uniref:Uncharacterized protein n=1 Tax=Achlya hypogyna TaxID=1202772 RepID=A0A1V9YCE7_ACHHY|nr:hypothetical protein ACHHYP_14794 [Achlya hypogyna]
MATPSWPTTRQLFVGIFALGFASLLYNFWVVTWEADPVPPAPTAAPRYTLPPEALTSLKLPAAKRDASIAFDDIFNVATGYTPKFPWAKRGIVLSLHNHVVPMGASLLQELRALGNYDPVQVYYCLPDELSPVSIDLLESDPLVETIDVCSLLLPTRLFANKGAAISFQNFWLKPLALLHSSFDEVMLLDADDIFFENPAQLWNASTYLDLGMVFFYDRVINQTIFLNNPVNVTLPDGSLVEKPYISEFFKLFPLDNYSLPFPHEPSPQLRESMVWNGLTAHEQDSSVVVLDKARAGPNVLRALFILIAESRFLPIVFSYGDKESFWLAFELAGRPYAFSPWACGVVSQPDDMSAHNDTLCGSLAQYWPGNASRLLYVNGQDIISPYYSQNSPFSHSLDWGGRYLELVGAVPRHVTPRMRRHPERRPRGDLDQTCLVGEGAVLLSNKSRSAIIQRIVWGIDVAQAIESVFPGNPRIPTVVLLIALGVVFVMPCVAFVILTQCE